MNFVEPIRSKEKVNDIMRYFSETSKRNQLMFAIGIYTGLRISDILKLRVSDVSNQKYFDIIEKKTGKKRKFSINPELKKLFNAYCVGKEPNDYLIQSREGYNKPISRDMAYKIINQVCYDFGVENCGTHTLRKTFGYHYYQETGDLETLRIIFQHSHWSITAKYIGITKETIDEVFMRISY